MNYEQEIIELKEYVFNLHKRVCEVEKNINSTKESLNVINSKLDQIIEKSTITQTNKRAYLDKEIVYDEFGKQGIGKKRALNEIEKKYCVKRSHDNCRTHSITYDGRNFRGIIIIKR